MNYEPGKGGRSQIGIIAHFKGLKVEEMTRLRRQLQESSAEPKVVKNTLLRRAAADDSPIGPLLSHFTGPNALTLGYAPGGPCRDHDLVRPGEATVGDQGCRAERSILSAKDLEPLSKLPFREVLLAQLLGDAHRRAHHPERSGFQGGSRRSQDVGGSSGSYVEIK
jgi:large subunit ribosomal protein L10